MNLVNIIWACRPQSWSDWATIFIAVFTGLLYLVNDKLTSDSEAIQRAWISYVQTRGLILLDSKTDIPVGFLVVPSIENSGGTPAIEISQHASGQWVNGELPHNFGFKDTWDSANVNHLIDHFGVLVPHAPFATNSIHIPIPDLQAMIADPTKSLFYIWGWVTYRDIFRRTQTRLTEFCVYSTIVPAGLLTPPKQQRTPPESITWSACNAFNCIDEHCADYEQRLKAQELPSSP